jgi:glycosyltransferase involved in cell wall biosynthesis
MKIGFVTPLQIRSAIGKHGRDVGAALQKAGWAIEFLRSEVSKEPNGSWDTEIPVSWLAEHTIADLRNQYDILIYNLGDDYTLHGRALDMIPHCSGILIAHDFYMYDLFLGWLATQPSPDRLHASIIKDLYQRTPYGLQDVNEGRADLGEVARHYPMIEWLSQFCVAAVAHSKFYANRLRRSCAGPVHVIPLAYEGQEVAVPRPRNDRRLQLATLGNGNPNKRISSVIRAIGQSPVLRNLYEYKILGEARSPHKELWEAEAAQLGLHGFEITGYLSEPEFARRIAELDVITCLRDPVFEGASGSLVEALLSARPVIVTDHGCYADVPRECAFHIGGAAEHQDLQSVLERIVSDESGARRVGINGRRYALERHSVAAYADELAGLMEAAVAQVPLVAAASQLGESLRALGVAGADPVIDRVASSMGALHWSFKSEWS